MKKLTCLLCLLAVLCMTAAGASAETIVSDPLAIVSYDRTALIDWLPGYRLNIPGVLLELSHTEGLISLSVKDSDGLRTGEYLSDQLDRAGEMLSVSHAEITSWNDFFGGDGRCLSYAYTYPDGDETHLLRTWAATYQDDFLLELTIDTWGEDAASLMETAASSLIGGGFTITRCDAAVEVIATLTDIVQNEAGAVQIQLTDAQSAASRFHSFSETAVVLFPNPDDPSMFCPVHPDMASLVDAVLTHEENSDSPAIFRVILQDDLIMYMEYHLLTP